MSADSTTVASYGDLIAHDSLNVERADAVAHALTDGAAVAIHAPEWLLYGSDLTPVHHPEVVGVSIERESKKAYLVDSEGGEDWLPKSQIEVFEGADDASFVVPGLEGGRV